MNWIYHKSQALSRDQCLKYIEKFEDNKKIKWKGPNNNYCNLSKTYFYQAITLDVFECSFYEVLKKNLNTYANEHPFLQKKINYWNIESLCNFQKYKPGEFYEVEHCEHGENDISSRRIIAWMIYLNDIHDGGGTCWPQQDFTTTPREGDLYIWPAGWTHSHYGIVSNKETKYIITGWCSYVLLDKYFV